MIEIDGKTYELEYSIKRIKLIEAVLQNSLMGLLQKSGGTLAIHELCVAFAYGLKDTATGNFVPPQTGIGFAERLIQENGLAQLTVDVVGKIQEDCPFFFRVG